MASEREGKRRAAGAKSPSGQDLSRRIPQPNTAQGSLPAMAAPGQGALGERRAALPYAVCRDLVVPTRLFSMKPSASGDTIH